MSPLYQGPYKVLDKKEKFFKTEVGGQPEVVSMDRLKPHLGMARRKLRNITGGYIRLFPDFTCQS